MVPQRWVFHVCESKLTLNKSLGHQHMRAVYHRGRSHIASTSESHGGDLIIQREPDKSEDKAEGGTFVASSIPCSHRGRALVIKGAEEVENAKANSKDQDRTEGQRPRNFIRPVSMDFSSRELKARDFGLMQGCSTKERNRQYVVLYLFYSKE
ncbi:hypothetical protein B296_00001490 [Ensete ventricosum]|uniref:Uncharacterized protein n=1 Tax=Ensete ventricosum TaxID=4639 RepID=A0A426Z7U5_ENSVE|nr:hypothetical protein B296_00001490 [Ensete ventricosum]